MARELDLTEPRSVWAIVGTALSLYARYPLLFLILAGTVVVPYELIVLALSGYGPLRESHIPGAGSWLVIAIGTALVTPLVSALHIHAVNQAGAGNRPMLRKVAVLGVRALPVVAATSIMFALGTIVGFALLVIPGVILSLRWAVAPQAAALDNVGWQEALKRSAQLTRGHYAHILGLYVVGSLIAAAIWIGPDVIATGHASSAPLVALGIAIQTLLQSFSALTFALLYFDLSARPRDERPRTPAYEWRRDLEP